MSGKNVIDESAVRAIANVAMLPLAKNREATIASPLSQWIKDANELNRKMSAENFREITPITIFKHPK
jgi:3-methyladenine DNA glycosylase AlkC